MEMNNELFVYVKKTLPFQSLQEISLCKLKEHL